MKILHIQKVKGIAGSENHLLTLLPKLASRGLDITMLVLADGKDNPNSFVERMLSSGVKTEVLNISGNINPFLPFRLAKFIRTGQYTLIHTHLIHADLYGSLGAALAGRMVLSSRHNTSAFRNKLPYRLAIRLTNQIFTKIICISENVKKHTIDIEHPEEQKVTVVHYGMEPYQYLDVPNLREHFGWAENVPLFGIVARLIEEKAHDILVQAMSHIVKNSSQAKLIIVGDGPLRQNLEKQVIDLDVSGNVRFMGFQADAALMMPAFDVFVHPSRREGFGMALLEAMSASLPIVATNVASLPEIVAHGETGILVGMDDDVALAAAMLDLIKKFDTADQMGLAGRKRLEEHFSVKAMIDKTLAIYQELIPIDD